MYCATATPVLALKATEQSKQQHHISMWTAPAPHLRTNRSPKQVHRHRVATSTHTDLEVLKAYCPYLSSRSGAGEDGEKIKNDTKHVKSHHLEAACCVLPLTSLFQV